MTDNQEQSNFIPAPIIKRGSLTTLSLYEITDYELDILESGGPSSIYLNFAIFLLSIAFGFLITILTVDVKNIKIFTFFLSSTTIGFVLGVALLIIWNKTRLSISKLCVKIRGRIVADDSPSPPPCSPTV